MTMTAYNQWISDWLDIQTKPKILGDDLWVVLSARTQFDYIPAASNPAMNANPHVNKKHPSIPVIPALASFSLSNTS